jgi:hypothetical protein
MSNIKKRPTLRAERWVRKSNGKLERYKRSKLRASIIKAGATQKQARRVTTSITKNVRSCNVCKDINGKKEVSSANLANIIISELQKINPNAATGFSNYRTLKQQSRPPDKQYMTPTQRQTLRRSPNESKRLAYTNRINTLSTEITSITNQTNNSIQRIENFNERIHTLPTRITRIRQGNYRALTHLEKDQIALSEKWTKLSPDLRTVTNQKSGIVQYRTRELQQTLIQYQNRSPSNLSNLNVIESNLLELRRNLSEIQGYVTTSLTPLEKNYQQIDTDLQKAERTVTLIAQASFPWIEGETPIISTKVKDLINDSEGILTLTNLNFIFEHEKEIVLKKRLFIVTEKKIVREVAVHHPIGMVAQMTKGRVGLLKGSGLFVQFVPESGISEMKFDTKGNEADWIAQSYNYIISGLADQELSASTPETEADKETPQLVTCPICGAPYNEKIYRGQTSVNCKYCQAVIAM